MHTLNAIHSCLTDCLSILYASIVTAFTMPTHFHTAPEPQSPQSGWMSHTPDCQSGPAFCKCLVRSGFEVGNLSSAKLVPRSRYCIPVVCLLLKQCVQ